MEDIALRWKSKIYAAEESFHSPSNLTKNCVAELTLEKKGARLPVKAVLSSLETDEWV